MSFFYDLNKKLDSIRATPEVTHQQLNERDEGKPGKNFAKIAKDAGERYGSKAAGERVAGAVRNKLKSQGKLEERDQVGPSAITPDREYYKTPNFDQYGNTPGAPGAWAQDARGQNKYVDRTAPGVINKIKDKLGYDMPDPAYGPRPDERERLAKRYPAPVKEADVEESAFQAAIGKKKYGADGMKALQKAGRDHASAKTMSTIRNKYDKYDESMEESGGPATAPAKSMVDKSAATAGRTPSYVPSKPSKPAPKDNGMGRIVQGTWQADPKGKVPAPSGDPEGVREAGAPMTAKQKSFAKLAPPANKITFADKIAGAKKEVDEMLGDVAAEAMRSALGGGRGRNAEMDEDNAFDYKSPRKDAPRVGSIERGHKHDIKHTATGRMVTRRTDDQGNSVGADDDSDTQAGPRGRGRPKGTKGAIGAKGPSGKSKLMTKEGEVDIRDQGEYDQEGNMAKDDIKTIVRHAQALSRVLGDNDNLPEWVQSKLAKIEGMMISIDEYMQNQAGDDGEQPIAEKAVSKQQQKFMGMAHAMQKGEKIKGASKELKKVARTMKPKDTEDFAKTKHKGLPDKVKSKKKEEEEVEESTTSGSVATSTAKPAKSGGVSYGKGIYDSFNRDLEQMIAESMTINMSDSTEGNKSLTVTATDDDAMKLAMMLKSAGLGGGDMHSHGEEACDTCGMQDCGCGDVEQAIDENSPDWPTNKQKSDNALQYSGGLNKPKTDVAGDGQTTVPNTNVHTQEEDALRRMMEMAGLAEAAKPDFLDLDKDGNKNEPMKDAADDKEEDTVEESIRRMMEIAGVKKKSMDEQKTEEGNLFTKGLEDDDVKIGDKIPGTNAIKKKDIDESIFALTNQWQAYKG